MKSEKRKVGDIGEGIASMYLEKHGFTIVERNYLKPWGEIDIIAKKNGIIHFVEVKTLRSRLEGVIHETDKYQAEENIHAAKLKRIARTMQSYLLEKGIDEEWCFDVAIVTLDSGGMKAKVKFLENIVL